MNKTQEVAAIGIIAVEMNRNMDLKPVKPVHRTDALFFVSGMSLYWAVFVWQIFPLGLLNPSLADSSWTNGYAFDVHIGVLLLCIFWTLARRRLALKTETMMRLLLVVGALLAVDAAFFAFLPSNGYVLVACYWSSIALYSALIVLLTSSWVYASSSLDSAEFKLYLPLSMLFSIIVGTLVQYVSASAGWSEMATATILPLLSGLLVVHLLRRQKEKPTASSRKPIELKSLFSSHYSIAFGALILYLVSSGVYYSVYTQGMSSVEMQGLPHKILGVVLIIAWIIFLRLFKNKDSIYAYPIVFFISLCIMVLYFVALFGSTFEDTCKAILLPTRACAIFLSWMVVFEISREHDHSPPGLMIAAFLPCITTSWMVVFKSWDIWLSASGVVSSELLMSAFVLAGAFILTISTFQLIKSRARGAGSRPATPSAGNNGPSKGTESILSDLKEMYGLSARETEVLKLLSEGHTKKKISSLLYVSLNSVQTYSKSLYLKLGVHKRQEVVDLVKSRADSSSGDGGG